MKTNSYLGEKLSLVGLILLEYVQSHATLPIRK